MKRGGLAVLVAAAVFLPGLAAAEPTTTTVPTTTTAPTTTVPVAETTLAVGDEAQYRAALASLSADAAGPHTIDLTADITVDDGTDPAYTGTEDLTIDGHGFTMDAVWTSRLLVVDSPSDAALTVTDVTIERGSTPGGGSGGAVLLLNDSPLFVADSRFWHNSASAGGGALGAATEATIDRSEFVDNATGGDGGALDAAAAEGHFTVRDSYFTNNDANGNGGAIGPAGFGSPSATEGIQRSTFTANEATEGGALVVGSGLVVSNSTFVGNHASASGGAVVAEGTSLSALIYTTLTTNSAPEGANLTNRGQDLFVIFTALGEPQRGANCAFVRGAFNVNESRADDASCPGARQVADLGLAALADNGGRTLTREPEVGSALIDAIPANYGFPSVPGGCADFLELDGFDQRGVERPQDGDGRTRTYVYDQTYEVAADCDVGAVEADAVVAPPTGPVAGGPSFTG